MGDRETDFQSYEKEKSLMVFGRDVSKIPCYRNSMLYGILGGIGTGLLRFLFTSRPIAGCNAAVGSFGVITLTYWIQCRYHYTKAKFEMERVQEMLQNRAIFEDNAEENRLEVREV